MEIIRKYPLTTLVAILIWVVCMIPVPETPLNEISFIDKWTHFVMYGTLSSLAWYENWRGRHSAPLFSHEKILLCVLAPIMQGLLVELAQAYLTTCRSGDWFDALCNTLGVLLGTLLASLNSWRG